ncbi:MAG: hypothetical protein M1818_007644 [Claussenomyces sp. TS43310]|nr:MAG: hypothetical protein M1818_007644 [Claussenomyces sp. TS43310]
METVPETERMEEFKIAAVPTLRLQIASLHDGEIDEQDSEQRQKPCTTRRATEPASISPRSPVWSSPNLALRPRNTSPYSPGHLRSRSTASALAPPMARASSMPGINAAGHLNIIPQRPSSPKGSPTRNRAFRKPIDEVFPSSSNRSFTKSGEFATAIPEDTEEVLGDNIMPERSISPNGLTPGYTFPKARRSASPLRNVSLHPSLSEGTTSTSTSFATYASSYQMNRADSLSSTYSLPASYASSSVPSTPTSIRSRSPSISSLETIPDTPDAEEAALEAERIAQLKAAADAADGDGDETAMDGRRTNSLDTMGSRGRTLGIVYGSRDKRKRWSVCGAERRGDLDLETIWED